MAQKHDVKDMDRHFVVDADSRKIVKETNTKLYLMQYDHNSEEFTFEVPLKIENHDMSKCDLIQVHYENTSVGTSVSTRKTYRGVYKIEKDDILVEGENVSFSWLIPDNATTFAGVLKFQLKFICYDSEDGTVEGYKWHSDVNEDIMIKAGLPYAEEDMSPSTTATLQSIEIVEMESGIDVILDGVHHPIYHGGYSDTVMDTVELKENKVTTLDEKATDDQYPSAKAVYEYVDSVFAEVNTLLEQVVNGEEA